VWVPVIVRQASVLPGKVFTVEIEKTCKLIAAGECLGSCSLGRSSLVKGRSGSGGMSPGEKDVRL
jgi:hypothetical protein